MRTGQGINIPNPSLSTANLASSCHPMVPLQTMDCLAPMVRMSLISVPLDQELQKMFQPAQAIERAALLSVLDMTTTDTPRVTLSIALTMGIQVRALHEDTPPRPDLRCLLLISSMTPSDTEISSVTGMMDEDTILPGTTAVIGIVEQNTQIILPVVITAGDCLAVKEAVLVVEVGVEVEVDTSGLDLDTSEMSLCFEGFFFLADGKRS